LILDFPATTPTQFTIKPYLAPPKLTSHFIQKVMRPGKYIAILLLIFFSSSLWAQENNEKETNWGIEFSGFANAQLFYDSRQMVEAREAMVSLFPKQPEYDMDGKDINKKASLNQLAMTSRLRFDMREPAVWGAKTSAAIEGDFTGQSNHDNNGFRLREAWAKLEWANTSLMIGSYWHPLYAPEIRPFTIGLNTGAPFHAFSRFNQVRIVQKINKLDLILFAGMQRDYASDGPLGRNPAYQRDAAFPNLDLQLQYNLGKHIIGGGIDYKVLQPRIDIDINNTLYKTYEKIASWAATFFARFEPNCLSIKLQSIWGQNLTEHIMLGGYSEIFKLNNNSYELYYVNSGQLSFWTDIITKGKKFKYGLFTGYAKNLGLTESARGQYYGTGVDISYLYRISPRIQYHTGKMMFATEFEYTVAAYGTPDNMGEIEDSSETGNLRVLLAVFYFF
jgi:hypothetical protein